jgi:hypothetical protein
MARTDWFRLLGYVTGLVNQELLLKNEYLLRKKFKRCEIAFTVTFRNVQS